MSVITYPRYFLTTPNPSGVFINPVVDYGADNTGASDTALALQAALDAVRDAGGGTVYLPAGTYLIGQDTDNGQTHSSKIKGGLKIGDNTTVCGDGWGTIVKIEGTSYSNTTWAKMNCFINDDIDSGNSNIVIRDLKCDGNRSNIVAAASEQEGIDFVLVDNFLIDNVWYIDAYHDTIDLDECSHGVISNCRLEYTNQADGWNGIHAGNANDQIRIYGNYLKYCGLLRFSTFPADAAGIDCGGDENSVIGNTLIDCYRAVLFESSANRGVVQGNNIQGGAANVYCIENASAYTNIVGNSIYVVTAGAGINLKTGSQGSVTSGNTIRCSNNGIYSENDNAVIENNLIRGTTINYAIYAAGDGATIVGNNIERKPTNAARGAIHLTSAAPNSVVSGNVIAGNQAGRAILSAANDAVITGNSVLAASSSGYEIEVTGDNNVVNGNRINGGSTSAIYLNGSDKALVTSNCCVNATATYTENSATNTTAANNTL